MLILLLSDEQFDDIILNNKNDKFHFAETCRFLLCYCDQKDFFDILRIIALKLPNIEYDTRKEVHIIFQS